jgi:hypothetical protein
MRTNRDSIGAVLSTASPDTEGIPGNARSIVSEPAEPSISSKEGVGAP